MSDFQIEPLNPYICVVAVRQEFVRQRLTDVWSEPHSNRQESSVISLHAVCTEVLGHIADPDKRLDIKDAPWTIIVQPCPICCMLSHTATCGRQRSGSQFEDCRVSLVSRSRDMSMCNHLKGERITHALLTCNDPPWLFIFYWPLTMMFIKSSRYRNT